MHYDIYLGEVQCELQCLTIRTTYLVANAKIYIYI